MLCVKSESIEILDGMVLKEDFVETRQNVL